MSVYFDRVCRVVVLNNEALSIEDHRIKFEITKAITQKDNSAKIEIFNLSNVTRKKIGIKETSAQLYAGYKEYQGAVQVGQGVICQVTTIRDKTDIVTRMLLKDGLSYIKNNPISFSYEKDVKLEEVLKKIAKDAGLVLKSIGIDSKAISGGYTIFRSLDYELNQLAERFDFDWSIQDKALVVIGKKQNISQQVVLLTPDSGLILNPESVKKVSQRLQKLKDKGEILNDIRLFHVHALLQPQLQVNDVIVVDSQDLSGKFRVHKLTHIGDTRGNEWYTKMEVKAL
ncbi:hypothetical protein Trichorick_01457 (plasmid) [Candidatus Trichorickettsia mobilis]|uniref:Uncharacterized protein n=1 Tax=Candidatus Trichorickettsia mobilis TaxID=1346319 RepID=A0ABZ0UZL8_9RICK|nr:hypothetical protein [Candidatus Trichorickettsia mobilis]WPY01544.1 hypothetical protein Trichorick_01457 [Candidatus Trichorickettsia mobilis]